MENNCILNGTLSGSLKNEVLRGMSAYEVAVANGYVGTEVSWLASLKGEDGEDAEDAVRYTEQNLTEEQKKQARANIGTVGKDFIIGYIRNVEDELELHKTNDERHLSLGDKDTINAAKQLIESGIDFEKQNTFTDVQVGDVVIEAENSMDMISFSAGDHITLVADEDNKTITISADVPKIENYVESIQSGTEDGTISVNINGEAEDIAVKGLGSAAYTDSNAYDVYGSADLAFENAKNYTDEQITINSQTIAKNTEDINSLTEIVNNMEEATTDDIDIMF